MFFGGVERIPGMGGGDTALKMHFRFCCTSKHMHHNQDAAALKLVQYNDSRGVLCWADIQE